MLVISDALLAPYNHDKLVTDSIYRSPRLEYSPTVE